MKAFVLAAAASVAVPPPLGWVSHAGPGKGFDGARECANYSPQWIVSTRPGGVQAEKKDYTREEDTRSALRLPQGLLLGSDQGEFGGSLEWQAVGSDTARRILDENVIAIVPAAEGSEALVVTGLAHLFTDYGRIYRVAVQKDGPVVRKVAEIGAMPLVVQLRPDGSLLMVTPQGLLRFWKGHVERRCPVDLENLNASSLAVISDHEVYVGLGLFIARLRLTGGACRVDWFVTNECQQFRVKEYECECIR